MTTSEKSWQPSETENKVEDTPCHILMEEVTLDAGSRIWWIVKWIVGATAVLLIGIVGAELAIRIFAGLHVNAIRWRWAYHILLLFLFSGVASTCWEIYDTTFTASDGCVEGVDLWTVQRIQVGSHCVYLDKVCLDYVPNPRKLCRSIDSYFYELTGGYLP